MRRKIFLFFILILFFICSYSQTSNNHPFDIKIDSVTIYFYPLYLMPNPELNKEDFISRSEFKMVYKRYKLSVKRSFFEIYNALNSIEPDSTLIGWKFYGVRSLYIFHFTNGKQEKLFITRNLECQFEGREEIFVISEELFKEMHSMIKDEYLEYY